MSTNARRTHTVVFDLLVEAAKRGNAEEVRRILKNKHPAMCANRALATAAAWGNTECLELLLLAADPCTEDSLALRWAAEFGQLECVQRLIPVSNIRDGDSGALFAACEYEYKDCIDVLFEESDVCAVLHNLKHEYPNNYEKWMYLQQKYEAQLLHTALAECSTEPKKHSKL